ncbi:hypothetical protein D3C71_1881270 [compost metagenome]
MFTKALREVKRLLAICGDKLPLRAATYIVIPAALLEFLEQAVLTPTAHACRFVHWCYHIVGRCRGLAQDFNNWFLRFIECDGKESESQPFT